jgi:hypothetical protein
MNKKWGLFNGNGVGKFFHNLLPFLAKKRMILDIGRRWDVTMDELLYFFFCNSFKIIPLFNEIIDLK